jgi:hypothetical protein
VRYDIYILVYVIRRLKVKIHTQLHVSTSLSQRQAANKRIKREHTAVDVDSSFFQISPPKLFIHFSSPPCVLHVPFLSFFFIGSPEKYLVAGTIHEASHYAVGPR